MKKLLIAALLTLPIFSFAEKNNNSGKAAESESAAMEGKIADITNYSPLSEVKVTIVSDKLKVNKTVRTDKEGLFHVDALPAGNYQVSFEREGYETLTRNSLIVQNDKKNSFGFFLFKD